MQLFVHFQEKKALNALLTIFFRQSITPFRERISQKMRIVEAFIARYLHSDEVWLLIFFRFTSQFYLQPLPSLDYHRRIHRLRRYGLHS